MHWDEEDWGFCWLTFKDFFFLNVYAFSLPCSLITSPVREISTIKFISPNWCYSCAYWRIL